MDFTKNEQGVTFISMLLTLIIITITLPFLVHMVSSFEEAAIEDDISIHQFFLFIRNDMMTARHVYHTNDTIYFEQTDDEIATIELYKNTVRRQVDGEGHELYVRNIKSFSIQSLEYGIKIIVTTLGDETYEKTIAYYNG